MSKARFITLSLLYITNFKCKIISNTEDNILKIKEKQSSKNKMKDANKEFLEISQKLKAVDNEEKSKKNHQKEVLKQKFDSIKDELEPKIFQKIIDRASIEIRYDDSVYEYLQNVLRIDSNFKNRGFHSQSLKLYSMAIDVFDEEYNKNIRPQITKLKKNVKDEKKLLYKLKDIDNAFLHKTNFENEIANHDRLKKVYSEYYAKKTFDVFYKYLCV